MLKSLLLATTISLLATSSALAADISTEQIHTSKYFPKGALIIEEGTGDKYMGYTLDQFKELLAMDQSLQYYMSEVNTMSQRLDLATEKNEKLTVLVSLTEKQRDLYKDDDTRHYEMWKDENKRRHEAEQSSLFSNTLFITALSAAIVEGLLIYVLIASDSP
jgi:hypothetical protein